MSEPTTFEFALIEVEDPDTPAAYLKLCGVQTTGFNTTVATNDRQVRDCAYPFRVPETRKRVTGQSRTLTGSGLYNVDQHELINLLPGKRRNYKFKMLVQDGPDDEVGELAGTWAGPGVCTALNIGGQEGDTGTIELTIESDGAWTFTPPA